MEINILNSHFRIEPFEHLPFWKSIANGEWEQDSYHILNTFTNSESIVMDVGSWAGPISLFAASTTKKVYALEPDPAIFPQLIHNVKLNPSLRNNLACFPLALYKKSGKQTLFARNKYGQSSSSLLERSRDQLSNEQCETITLADFIAQEHITKLDFIKLDIEGGEFELIPTLSQTLEHLNYPTLYISFHYSHLKESILKREVASPFLSKLAMKVEQKTKVSFFEKESASIIRSCFEALGSYHYIYNKRGEQIKMSYLLKNPSIIKTEDLVFTTKKWEELD